MNKEEEKLVAAYMAGEEVGEELLQHCRANPQLLKETAEHVAIDRLLDFEAQEEQGDLFTAEFRERLKATDEDAFVDDIRLKLEKKKSSRIIHFISYAAVACLLIMAGVFTVNSEPELGQIVKNAGAQWYNNSFEIGDELAKGKVKLTEGYAELLLNNGVQLLLEAPIDFELKTAGLIEVSYGQLVANVPQQAIGFTVTTPSSEIVDLGTKFAIFVDDKGGSEVHVLTGEVKARAHEKAEFVNLFKDDARAFTVNKQMSIIKSQPQRFVRALPGKSVDNPGFLHWSFDDEKDVQVSRGSGINAQSYTARLKGLDKTKLPIYENGQFGKALYFDGESAYVETNFPGIGGNNPRTIAFWAKVPDNFSSRNGYGMISWGLMKYGAAWQISPNPNSSEGPLGRLRTGTMGAPVIGITDLRDKRWHHIAIVMYGGDKADASTHIIMYIDGKLEKISRKSVLQISTKLDSKRSRPMTFGRNLAFADDRKKISDKFFKGWLDEIYVFDSALDQQQIYSLMKKNKLP